MGDLSVFTLLPVISLSFDNIVIETPGLFDNNDQIVH